MKMVATLVHRNVQAFWRDRMTVFFSLMSPIILFILFMIFFRRTIAELVLSYIPTAVEADAYAACDEWLFASVATLATFTSSLGMLTGFVEDRVSGRFADYLVAPVKRWQLALSYILATWLVSFVLSVILLFIGQAWALGHDQPLMSVTQDLNCVFGILLGSMVFSAFNTFIVTYTTTQGGFGGYSIIMGTAMGFLSFSYVPPANLSDTINTALSAMPFAQVAAIIRKPATEPAISRLMEAIPEGQIRDDAHAEIVHAFGIQLKVQEYVLSLGFMVALIVGVTVVLALLGAWRMRRAIR